MRPPFRRLRRYSPEEPNLDLMYHRSCGFRRSSLAVHRPLLQFKLRRLGIAIF